MKKLITKLKYFLVGCSFMTVFGIIDNLGLLKYNLKYKKQWQ